MEAKDIIARRIAQEFVDGMVFNLGFGIPNLSADYIPEGVNVLLQAENGAIGFGATPTFETSDPDLANSGGAPITMLPGSATFDLRTSFAIIRGGHVDITVLGALEVAEEIMLEAIMFGHDEIKKLIAFQEKIIAEIGKEKIAVTLYELDAELTAQVKAACEEDMNTAIQTVEKHAREEAITAV